MKRIGLFFILALMCCESVAMGQVPADWTKHPQNPLFTTPISWGTSIETASVIFWQGQYHLWYQGNQNGDWAQIGHATSADGITWTDDPTNPVVVHNHAWNEDALGWPCVIAEGDSLKMWFSAHNPSVWGEWWMCYAVSTDGTNWIRYQPPVFLPIPGQSLYGTVIRLDSGSYRMYFNDYATGSCGNIGIAESPDGVNWIIIDPGHIVSDHTWTYQGPPTSVVKDGDVWHMWYSGRPDSINCGGNRRIGYAQSLDGLNWYELYTQPALTVGDPGTWDESYVAAPSVVFDGSSWRMYYYTANWAIGLATTTVLDEILPVELLSFNAVSSNDVIRLSFSTASETDNDHFEIWKSENADDESALLTSISSQGNSASEHHYEYVDRAVEAGRTYWYYLADVDINGNRTEHRSQTISATAASSSGVPTEYILTAYPNPFNPTTTISFTLPEAGAAQVAVYDLTGREVAQLVSESLSSGQHDATFDASGLPSGIYLVRLQAGAIQLTQKVALVK